MRGMWLILVLSLSISVCGQNLLINGDFESGTAGWSQWWGGNSTLQAVDPVEGDKCGGVWWSDDGIYQGIAITAGTYTVSGQLMHGSLGKNRIGVIQVEVGNGTSVWWSQRMTLSANDPLNTWIDGSMVIDNTVAGATRLSVNLFLVDQDGQGTGTGTVRYDNISVVKNAALNTPNYNGDSVINLLDFSHLSEVWNLESESRNLSGDAVINLDDLVVFADAWLSGIPGYFGYELVWSDEFYGSSLNLADWEYMIGDGCSYGVCGWGNNELQYYRAENISVQDGKLVIVSKRENFGGKKFTSGRIRTANKRDFLYGRMEAKIKIPTGGGMWPAFWMMPTDSVYGGWAASGEIDIMESKNNTDTIGAALHFGGQWPNNASTGGSYSPGGINFADDFHVYTLEWEPDLMRWYVDGVLCTSKNSSQWYSEAAPGNTRAPFDQKFHLLLNAAVGGNYTGCTSSSCVTAAFPQYMVVDWVRVYQKTAP